MENHGNLRRQGLEETPTITSQQLKLFTAPGNELPELYFYPHWDRRLV